MSQTFQPRSGRLNPRFSLANSFFRLPIVDMADAFDVAVFGVPFDGAASYRVGSRFAPMAVRTVSALGRGYNMAREANVFDVLDVADVGDCPVTPPSLERSHAQIEEYVGAIAATGKRTLAVGGDHSITLPILRALKTRYGAPLALVHFDAHYDTYPAAWGVEHHHGAFLRHCVEEGLVEPTEVLQIGIRGPLASADDQSFTREHGIRVLTVDDIRDRPLKETLRDLPAFKGRPTYLTYDIDCLDPAFAPGTGTPVPGGLTTYEAQRILRALDIENLVGADIVEVCPPYDVSEITTLAAVDAMFEALGLMARSAAFDSAHRKP
jgi:agmatinase/guanidinopropionase